MSTLVKALVSWKEPRASRALAVAGGQTGVPARGMPIRGMAGAGLLVAVGYVDPGNWATDIAGGSLHGYALLSVVGLACLLAMAVQLLVARVTLATGADLATLSARHMPRPVALGIWLAGEAAIVATAVAELTGGAIALQLLFGLPLTVGLVVTAAGSILLMMHAHARGQQRLEACVNVLIAIVAISFLLLVINIGPDWGAAAAGVLETPKALSDTAGLMLALGIVGATIMPHNLYLHSGLIADRARHLADGERDRALRVASVDTVVALGLAMLVNMAIMIVAASSLTGGTFDVESLSGAHQAIGVALGAGPAIVFAIALYAAGQSSAITGMVAGRVLIQGFHGKKNGGADTALDTGKAPWMRGLVTRVAAVVIATALMAGGANAADGLLVLSQMVLGLALPFVLVPLVMFAARRDLLGRFALPRAVVGTAIVATAGLVALDLLVLTETLLG